MATLRQAFRSLVRKPGLSVTVTASLALGVGAVAAVLSVVDGVLLRPLPYSESDRIVEITMFQPRASDIGGEGRISYPDFLEFQRSHLPLSAVAALSEESFVLSGIGPAERIEGARVSREFFSIFDLAPALGGVPGGTWGAPGARGVVVSHAFWAHHFGRDPRILGASLRLGDQVFTVLGVMPPELDVPRGAQVWIPLDASDPNLGTESRGARYLRAFALLAEGVGTITAERSLQALSARLSERYPENRGFVASATPYRETLVRDLRPLLSLLMLAVSLVLLIVCLNVAGVLAVHHTSRSGDLWVRRALGAPHHRILLSLIAEHLILCLIGGGMGLLAAYAGSRWLERIHSESFRWAGTAKIRPTWILWGLGIILAISLLVSLPTVLQLGRRTAQTIAGKGSVGVGRKAARIQTSLVVLQIAATLAVLNAAGLSLRSVARLLEVNPGFRTEGILTARVDLPPYRYPQPFQRAAFFDQLLTDLDRDPTVRAAAAVTNLPLSGSDMLFGFTPLDGASARPQAEGDSSPFKAHYRAVSSSYFSTLGIPLVAGRLLTSGDAANAAAVALVNQTFARQFYPDRSAEGHRIRLMYGNGKPLQIVGVVGDFRHLGLAAEPVPEVFVPFAQQPWPFMTLAIRTAGDPEQAIGVLRSTVARLDPDQPVDKIATFRELVEASLSRPHFLGAMLGIFALLALTTAAIGVYGVASLWANARRQEIGVHLAFGATQGAIRRLSLRRPLAITLAGLALGAILANTSSRAFASLLYKVSPHDLTTLLAMAGFLFLTSMLAAWMPALRASEIDPAAILRDE